MYTSRAEQQIIENRRQDKNEFYILILWLVISLQQQLVEHLKRFFFLLLQPRKYLRFLTTVSYHFTVCNLFHFSGSAVTPVIFR